jgi:hypothetical protein
LRVAGDFVRHHPSVKLAIESSKSEEVISSVVAQRAALGLMEGQANTGDIAVEPWNRRRTRYGRAIQS